MRILTILAFSALLAFAAQAAEETGAIKVELDQEDCRRLEKHQARNDVTYKPGVDVHGKPVKPADLNSRPKILTDKIIIDLSLPLKDLYAADNSPKRELQGASVELGQIEYNLKSGKFYFNGELLADPALHELAVQCRERYGK